MDAYAGPTLNTALLEADSSSNQTPRTKQRFVAVQIFELDFPLDRREQRFHSHLSPISVRKVDRYPIQFSLKLKMFTLSLPYHKVSFITKGWSLSILGSKLIKYLV